MARKAKPVIVFVLSYEFWSQRPDGVYEFRHHRVDGVFKTRADATTVLESYTGGSMGDLYRQVRISTHEVR